MLESKTSNRMSFFDQLHHQFLYMKGYGAYAYVTPNDVDRLFDSYITQQKVLSQSPTPQLSEVSFIRAYIKSL